MAPTAVPNELAASLAPSPNASTKEIMKATATIHVMLSSKGARVLVTNGRSMAMDGRRKWL